MHPILNSRRKAFPWFRAYVLKDPLSKMIRGGFQDYKREHPGILGMRGDFGMRGDYEGRNQNDSKI